MKKFISNIKTWKADHPQETAMVKKMTITSVAFVAVGTAVMGAIELAARACDEATQE